MPSAHAQVSKPLKMGLLAITCIAAVAGSEKVHSPTDEKGDPYNSIRLPSFGLNERRDATPPEGGAASEDSKKPM